MLGGARERSLHHAGEAAVGLAYHRVHIVCGEYDDVDGRCVIGHADGARLGAVLAVVERDYGGSDTRQYAVQDHRAVPSEPVADSFVLDLADEKCRNECVEAG